MENFTIPDTKQGISDNVMKFFESFIAGIIGVGSSFILTFTLLDLLGSKIMGSIESTCYFATTLSFLALVLEKVFYSEGIIRSYKGRFFEPSGKWYLKVLKLLVLVSYSIILYNLITSEGNNTNTGLITVCWIVYSIALLMTAYDVSKRKSKVKETE